MAYSAREIVAGLLSELSEYIRVVPEREQLVELRDRCTAVGLEIPMVDQLTAWISGSESELVKAQLKGATDCNDRMRMMSKTHTLKDIFFEEFGRSYKYTQCPLLRHPLDFSKAKIFNKEKLQRTMLIWTKEPIPTSLTIIQDKVLVKESTRMFKNLLGWAGDKALSYPDVLAQEIISRGIQVAGLRNEIYAQIVKQLTNNSSTESEKKCWQLMHMCLDWFPPSSEFENYLEAFLRSQGSEHSHAVKALHTTVFNGAKAQAPTIEEIPSLANSCFQKRTSSAMLQVKTNLVKINKTYKPPSGASGSPVLAPRTSLRLLDSPPVISRTQSASDTHPAPPTPGGRALPSTQFSAALNQPPSFPAGAPPPLPHGVPPSLPTGAPPSLPHGAPPALPLGAPPSLPYGGPPSLPTGAPPALPQGYPHYGQ